MHLNYIPVCLAPLLIKNNNDLIGDSQILKTKWFGQTPLSLWNVTRHRCCSSVSWGRRCSGWSPLRGAGRSAGCPPGPPPTPSGRWWSGRPTGPGGPPSPRRPAPPRAPSWWPGPGHCPPPGTALVGRGRTRGTESPPGRGFTSCHTHAKLPS